MGGRQLRDLFGFLDVLAMPTGEDYLLGIQATFRKYHRAHVEKIIVERRDQSLQWLFRGGKIVIWSWDWKRIDRKVDDKKWFLYEQEITVADYS